MQIKLIVLTFVAVVSVNICTEAEPLAYLSKCQGQAKCQQKITINAAFTDQTHRSSNYIRIQKVKDKESGRNFTLINPLILKIYSYLPKQIYPLKLIQIVNNKVHEVFYHHDNTEDFKGCNKHVLNHRCGKKLKGFCCSCDGIVDNFPYHIRGGQECFMNQSSAHCIKYDPLWYSVNTLENPQLYHNVVVNLYRTGDNHVTSVKVGSLQTLAKKETISVSYSVKNEGKVNYKDNLILIPQINDTSKSQIMMLNKSLIGEECDKIGVTVKAFNHQPQRCHKVAQSCLNHQPMDFWLEDRERIVKKKPVKYFIKEQVTGLPKIIESNNTQWSLLAPGSDVKVLLSINITADHILMIPQQLKKVIRECVYIDNNDEMDNLYVILYNQGYLHEEVFVSLLDCNVSISGIISTLVQLAPHRTQHIVFTFKTGISSGGFTCTVYVNGENDNDRREITLQKQHKCVCILRDKCNCGDEGYYRKGMLSKEGLFRGPFDSLFILAVFMVILAVIGFVKACFSLWFPITVGEFGLCLFTHTRVISVYHEKYLQKYEVVYNEKGVPINPITKEPVQILTTLELFILNLCFGYYLLFIGLHWLMLKMLGLDTKYQYQREQKSWHQKLITPVISPTDYEYDQVQKDNSDKHKGLGSVRRKLFTITDKQLAYEQYRKQKKEMTKLRRMSVDKGEKSLKKQKKSTPGKTSSISSTLPVADLLKLDPVFFNYQTESALLKNSGKCFSLCGKLCKHGRRYKFDLGPYNVQMYENIDGQPVKLQTPQTVIHPIKFSTELNATAIHQFITTELLFPCLNSHFTYHQT